MHMIDFEYNGELLSDYDCMICSFDSSSDTVDVGNNITINSVRVPNNDKHMSVGSSYEEPLVVPFSICPAYKCKGEKVIEGVLNDEKINEIMRWLNRRGYYKFVPIYDDNSFEEVFYYGTFNLELVKFGDKPVGFNLTLNTNAPYGFIENNVKEYTFDEDNKSLTIFDMSDEVGVVYADVTIKCLGDGDLILKNSLDEDNNISIKNCLSDEVITLYGEQKIITSSRASHNTLYNDFNYNYVRIKNTYDDNKNIFTSNIDCEISISYYPIRKVGIVL